MSELLAVWKFAQEVGQVSLIGIAVALFFIWKNDLKHISKDMTEMKGGLSELRTDLKEHINWHLEQGR